VNIVSDKVVICKITQIWLRLCSVIWLALRSCVLLFCRQSKTFRSHGWCIKIWKFADVASWRGDDNWWTL